jgi:hypothetical protein
MLYYIHLMCNANINVGKILCGIPQNIERDRRYCDVFRISISVNLRTMTRIRSEKRNRLCDKCIINSDFNQSA